jgi:hypothetical protein
VSGRRLLAVLGAVIAFLGMPGAARAQDQGEIFRRYADIRERLYSCQIEAAWDLLTADRQRSCRKLEGSYVLYTWPGENWTYHVHCRRKKRCPATPYGEPPADGPIPAGSRVFG